MRKLLLLRHAQTLPTEGLPDRERRLTPQGQADSQALGQLMSAKGYQPDFIFCSPAQRTVETMNGILDGLNESPSDSPPILYEGTQGDYFHLIQNAHDDVQNLLMIAHNPSIHSLAASLAAENSPTPIERIVMGYAPGTLSVFECACERWATLQPGTNGLIDLLEPSEYGA